MELNGVPLHPLVVHAAVVFVPLAALAVLAFGLVPRWRWVLRWPMLVTGVLSALCVQLAAMSGDDLKDQLGVHSALIEQHETWAGRLQVGTWVLAAVVLVAVWVMPFVSPLADRARSARPSRAGRAAVLAPVLTVVLPLLALVELYLVFRTGDAGAKAVWAAGH